MSVLHEERMARFSRAGLYLVTGREHSAGRDTERIVDAALAAGVRLVQLREKGLEDGALFALALRVRGATAAAGALLLVNDRVDIAVAAGADGVHLGQGDLPVDAARRIAPDLVIGASTHSREDALRAQSHGASYVNIGPVFATATKAGHRRFLGIEGVREIGRAVSIPFTVMGGIKREHVRELAAAGAAAIAVVTAVTAAADPGAAAGDLLAEIRKWQRRAP